MNRDRVIREQLLHLLQGGNAHLTFDRAIEPFPEEQMNKTVSGSYSPWQLLEHIRISLWDILEFVRNPDHVSPEWPDDYWPSPTESASLQTWEDTIKQIRLNMQDVFDLVNHPDTDFLAPLPHAKDYTLFREILLIADHNAYHLGQLVTIRKILGIWS